jgi:cystine transport system substrate-binding protein
VRARRQTLRSVALVFFAAVLVGIALPAAGTGAPGGQSATSLHARQTELQRRSHEALLQLYSVETRLQAARARIAALDRQKAALRRQSAAIHTSLRAARKTIAATQRNLADRARAFYESGGVNDPIAIMLGAESINAALDRLEAIERIANQQQTVLRQAQQARARLLRLKARLAKRQAQLDALRATVEASTRSLEAARSDKESTLDKLSNERALTRRRLASLSTQASSAASTSVETESSPSTGGGTSAPSGPLHSGQKLTVSATNYCLTGTTASGLPVGPGIMATDPSVIPLGTRASVPGYGVAVAADTGSAVKGLTIDLWVADCDKAIAFGRQTLTITIL